MPGSDRMCPGSGRVGLDCFGPDLSSIQGIQSKYELHHWSLQPSDREEGSGQITEGEEGAVLLF